jgi:GTPase SAR1 family protein
MTPEARRKYFNLCDPDAPLDPDDGRAVDIDEFGADQSPVRGGPWVDELIQDLTLSNTPRCDLLTGLPGSGKSTLLRRLKRELERSEKGAPNFLCVLVNAEQWVDPSAPIDAPDVLLAIVFEVERAVLVAEGASPDGAAQDGAVSRLWDWLSNTDATLKQFDASLGADVAIPEFAKLSTGAKAVVELKTNPTLRQQVRRAVEERMYTFLQKVREYLKELHRRARKTGREGIVVVVDSLEKLRGIASNFDSVLESAEKLFTQGAPYLHLADPALGAEAPRIHALYTVPPALVLRRAIHDLRFLPMIKLRDRKTDALYDPGYKAARELIRRRVPDNILADVFGATVLEARCQELIRWSGGYPREIVRMLRECVKQSATVDERLFRRLLTTASDTYRRTVTADALPWLARVKRFRGLEQSEDAKHRLLIARALSDNLVLRYKNDEEWFDVHPALAEMPALVAAGEALDRELAAAKRGDG